MYTMITTGKGQLQTAQLLMSSLSSVTLNILPCGLQSPDNLGHVWTAGALPPPYIYHIYCLLTSPGNLGHVWTAGAPPPPYIYHIYCLLSSPDNLGHVWTAEAPPSPYI